MYENKYRTKICDFTVLRKDTYNTKKLPNHCVKEHKKCKENHKNVFVTGGIEHTIWTQNDAAHVWKHRKLKILNILIFLFIDVIIHGMSSLPTTLPCSKIAVVVTRTGCTAVVNESKKLSVLGERMLSQSVGGVHVLVSSPSPACAVQQIPCHREDLLACCNIAN